MKKCYYLKRKENMGYTFNGCYVFENSKLNKNLIISPSGTNMMIDNILLEKLKKEKLDEDFLLKLIQRGFVEYENSRKIINTYHIVKPTFFLLDLTEYCNLKCAYCFRNLEGKKMTEEKAKDICEYIKNYCLTNNIKNICIQPWGGEPLLEFELIKKIQDFFENSKIKVKMVIETNATLIDAKIAKELFERNFGIGISIDGNEILHNNQRKFHDNRGSYDKVIRGIKCLNNAGYDGKLGAICVITKNNYNEIDRIMEHFITELNLKNIKFNLVRTNEKNIKLSEEKIKRFATKMMNTTVKMTENEKNNFFISDIRDRIENLLFRCNNSICISCGCMSGRKMISFNKDGDIFPCEMSDFESEKIGNIYEDEDLIKIIKKSIDASELYKERKIKRCDKCPWWYYCRGGCKANKVYQYTFAKNIDKHECIYNRVIYKKIIDLWLTRPELINQLIKGGEKNESNEQIRSI